MNHEPMEQNQKVISFLTENGWKPKAGFSKWFHPEIENGLTEINIEAACDIQRAIRDAKESTPFERLMSVLERIADSLETIRLQGEP